MRAASYALCFNLVGFFGAMRDPLSKAFAGMIARGTQLSPQDAKFNGLRKIGSAAPIAEAVVFWEVMLLAFSGAAVAGFAAEHAALLGYKSIIDATSNLGGMGISGGCCPLVYIPVKKGK
jgi:hypothetical protein